jgi:hypothetical protein
MPRILASSSVAPSSLAVNGLPLRVLMSCRTPSRYFSNRIGEASTWPVRKPEALSQRESNLRFGCSRLSSPAS